MHRKKTKNMEFLEVVDKPSPISEITNPPKSKSGALSAGVVHRQMNVVKYLDNFMRLRGIHTW